MTILDDLFAVAETAARRWFQQHPKGQWAPLFHGRAQSGPDVVILASFGNQIEKAAALAEVKRRFRERQVIAYAALVECWASPSLALSPGEVGEHGPTYRDERRPRHMPDRYEGILVLACDGVTAKSGLLRIERDARGRVADLIREPSDASQPAARSGVLAGLLGA